MAQALNMMMRCFEVTVRDQDEINFQSRFDLSDITAFFV